MDIIDFRSDSMTHPTQEMRESILNAALGDDQMLDDPTVQQLQNLACQIFGKEGCLLVPSGTFGNQVCINTHTNPRNEIIVSEQSHILLYEAGAAPLISQVQLKVLPVNDSSVMDLNLIENSFNDPTDNHQAKTALVCIENPTNYGQVVPLDYIKRLREICDKNGAKIHLDGSRIFNAAAALKTEVKDIVQYVDSVMICLSKGLCAFAGSLILGNKEFIQKAGFARKALGGIMRQSGVIAAPGIIALQTISKYIYEDNENCFYLATKLKEFKFTQVDLSRVQINMVFFYITDETVDLQELQKFLAVNKIIVGLPANHKSPIRLMTHYYITKERINIFLELLESFCQQKIQSQE